MEISDNLTNKEMLEVVNENDEVIGTESRKIIHEKGLLHRISVIYLTREDGEILIQERMDGRLDHSSAGHVDIGENYLQAAKRELEEELGVKAELIKIGKTASDEIDPKNKNRVRHIFEVFECQTDPGNLAESEVKSVFWADPKAIYEEMKNDADHKKFCGGFKASLKFYLESKKLI